MTQNFTAMELMGTSNKSFKGKARKRLLFPVLLAFTPPSYILAANWEVTPSITLSETYSDNINLVASGNKQEAFVTELNPGVSIRKEGAHHNLILDYRLQYLQNSGSTNRSSLFHQLQLDSNTELLRNSLFLDLNSRINQQNNLNSNSATDNLSGNQNRTNITEYSISPYWTPHLNGYATGEVRFNYNKLSLDNSLASDAENFDYSVRLNSGRRFSKFTWLIDYSNRNQVRATNSVKFQDMLLELRANINRHYNVFTRLGYSKNNFQSASNQNNNGFFYSVGGNWRPNQHVSIEAAVGNNSFVTVDIAPTRRMHWVTTYRNNDIGTNTGDVWETRFDFETKRFVWAASYQEETTTTQRLLSTLQNFTLVDAFGQPIIDPVTQQIVQTDISLPQLVDDVILTKEAALSVAYRSGKSDISARLFRNRTTFQLSQSINNVIGLDGSWNWQFHPRTSFFIRPAWQQTKRTGQKNNRYDLTLRLNRRLPISIAGRGQSSITIEYRYINQLSNIQANNFTENRISANLLFSY